jgi:hypothetical protein
LYLAVGTAGYAGIGVGAFILYVFLLAYFGLKTIKGGHWVMFILGFFFFPFWIVGGIMPPKGMSRIDAMYAEKNQQS